MNRGGRTGWIHLMRSGPDPLRPISYSCSCSGPQKILSAPEYEHEHEIGRSGSLTPLHPALPPAQGRQQIVVAVGTSGSQVPPSTLSVLVGVHEGALGT
jgi:hypothetical protein